MSAELLQNEEQDVNANQPLLAVISRKAPGFPRAEPVNISECLAMHRSVKVSGHRALSLLCPQQGSECAGPQVVSEWDKSYQTAWPLPPLRGSGPRDPGSTSHCLLGSGLFPVAHSPGAEGCNELAGEAEATLRAKGECGLRSTGDDGCHSLSPSPDGHAPSSRGQGEGSHLPKGGFWLEVRNSSLGDFWEQSAKVG